MVFLSERFFTYFKLFGNDNLMTDNFIMNTLDYKQKFFPKQCDVTVVNMEDVVYYFILC